MTQFSLPPSRDVAVPSEVIPPGQTTTPVSSDSCPFCGADRAAGPEGGNWSKDFHCWKCGYRPDVNAGVSDYQRRQQYDSFNRWLDSQTVQDRSHSTLQPPSPETDIAAMQRQINELQNQVAGSHTVNDPTPQSLGIDPNRNV